MGTNIAALFFISIGVAYFIYILIVFFACVKTLKSISGWVVMLIIMAFPPMWFLGNQWVKDKRQYRDNRAYSKLVSNYKENLKQACAEESTFTIHRKIPKKAVIFVAPPLEWKLDTSGDNPHLTKCLQEDALTSAERRVCRVQFDTSIRWNKYDTLRFTQQYGKAILELENKSHRTGHKWQSQFFTDYPKDSPIYGIEAPKQWWLQTGLGDTLTGKDGLNNFGDFGMARTDRLYYLSLSQSLSTYQFNTGEISTLSDRAQGIRRFKLALIDKQTNEMIAEYIGFDSSNHAPSHSFGGYAKELSEVNCITQLLGEPLRRRFERDYLPSEKVFKYFFEQVIDDNAVQPAPRIYHYP